MTISNTDLTIPAAALLQRLSETLELEGNEPVAFNLAVFCLEFIWEEEQISAASESEENFVVALARSLKMIWEHEQLSSPGSYWSRLSDECDGKVMSALDAYKIRWTVVHKVFIAAVTKSAE